MASLIGQFTGAIFGMALFGSIVALILRKLLKVSTNTSFIAGLAIMLLFAIWAAPFNGSNKTMGEAALLYGVGSIFAYFVMVVFDGKATAEDSTAPKRDFTKLKRFFAWIGFVLLAAFGSTSIFTAFNAFSDKGFFFLIGSICLICSFLIWRALTAKNEA